MPEPKRSGRAKAVPYHPLVEALASDPTQPPKPATSLFGFPGPAAAAKSTRLWLDLGLTSYVDVPDDAILHSRTLDDEEGTILWVDPAATLSYSTPPQQQVQADFLAGSIAQRNLAGAPAAAMAENAAGTKCCTEYWWCYVTMICAAPERQAAQADFLRGPIAERNLAGAPAAAAAQRPIGPNFPSGIGCHRSIFFYCPSEFGLCRESCWPYCDVFEQRAAAPAQRLPHSIGIVCPTSPPICAPFQSHGHLCVSVEVRCPVASGGGFACPVDPLTPVIDPVGPFQRRQ